MSTIPPDAAPANVAFTELLDLAAQRLGGRAIAANDEFFAEKENLLRPGRGIFLPEKFTDRGKWMDGWETRRRREPGHDWCIVRLGFRGRVHGVDVDTNHFLGNFPERCSIELCDSEPQADVAMLTSSAVTWREAVAPAMLHGGSRNLFAVTDRAPATHLRLNIFPDGGVARLRVHGEVVPDFSGSSLDNPIDLAAVEHGGVVVTCNDMFFGTKDNLIMPGAPENMGQGWETRRRRRPGNDWIVIRLGAPAHLERIELDTTHFKGNAPESCSIECCNLDEHTARHVNFATDQVAWAPLLARNELNADSAHRFDDLAAHGPCTHLRLNIFPDGGVARLRAYGQPVARTGGNVTAAGVALTSGSDG